MKIVYTVPLASRYEIWQRDQMSGCVSEYKHMLEAIQKQDTVWKLPRIILKLCGFLKMLQIAYFLHKVVISIENIFTVQ